MDAISEPKPPVLGHADELKDLPPIPAEAQRYEDQPIEGKGSHVSQPARKIIVMGATGAGKSTFINQAADSTLEVSGSLVSCTRTIGIASMILEDGTPIELIDTPGFDDSVRSDIEILEEIATALKDWDDIYGVIYLHRISDFKISGAARKTFSACFNICGEKAMPWLTIVTNMWDKISPELGEAREDELRQKSEFFETAINFGATILRNDSPPTSAKEIVRKAVRQRPVHLLVQFELHENGGDVLSTTAGTILDQEMAEKRAKHEAELAKISEEYAQALQQQDDETQAELEEERAEIQKKISDMQAISNRIKGKQRAKTVHGSQPTAYATAYGRPASLLQVLPASVTKTSVDRAGLKGEIYERTDWQHKPPREFDNALAPITGGMANRRSTSRAMSLDEIERGISQVKQEVLATRSGVYPQPLPTTETHSHGYYNTAETSSHKNKRASARSSTTADSRHPRPYELHNGEFIPQDGKTGLLSKFWPPW